MSSGRHAEPDRIGIILGSVVSVLGAVLLFLLALVVREPCPCAPSGTGLAPSSVPDSPVPDLAT